MSLLKLKRRLLSPSQEHILAGNVVTAVTVKEKLDNAIFRINGDG